MSSIGVADIHMTGNPREEERWGLFDWLRNEARARGVKELIICGDGTEAKDRHNAAVVHRMVDEISLICEDGIEVIWIKGNHDYLDPDYPFFKFLEILPKFTFIGDKPIAITLSIGKCIMLPNTNKWEEDWAGIDFSLYDYAFAHQTFKNAVTETGYRLVEGIPPSALDGVRKKAYSGDIHVPQKFGKKGEYIGAPYRTRYGDNYKGRVLLITPNHRDGQMDLHYPITKGKHLVTIRSLHELQDYKDVPRGGSVKVRVKISRAEMPDWTNTKAKVKEEVAALGWDLHDVEMERVDTGLAREEQKAKIIKAHSPHTILDNYCDHHRTPESVIEQGHDILRQLGVRA